MLEEIFPSVHFRHLGFKTAAIALFSLLATASLSHAELKFEASSQTVPAKWSDKEVVAVYRFANTGNTAVKVTGLESSCKCTTPTLAKREIAPGESAEVRAVFAVGDRTGAQNKTITLTTDQPGQPRIELTFKTDIPFAIGFDRLQLHWPVGSAPEAKTVQVTLPADLPVDRVEITGGTEGFFASLKPIQGGKSYQVIVTTCGTRRTGWRRW